MSATRTLVTSDTVSMPEDAILNWTARIPNKTVRTRMFSLLRLCAQDVLEKRVVCSQ